LIVTYSFGATLYTSSLYDYGYSVLSDYLNRVGGTYS